MSLTSTIELEDGVELTPRQQQQVVEAGRRFDGEDLSIDERLDPGSEEACLLEMCEILSFVNTDGATYDVVWIEGGCGTVFRADTLDVAAEIMELEVASADADLQANLGQALKAGW